MVWPTIVVAIPMGITFAAARVYAESSSEGLRCDAGHFVACADAGERSRCSTGNQANDDRSTFCLKAGSDCYEGDPFHSPTRKVDLQCRWVYRCGEYASECDGKSEGAPCELFVGNTRGTCKTVADGCYEIVDDAGILRNSLNCVPSLVPDAAPATSTSTSSSSSSGAADGPARENNDSGCASSPGTVTGIAGVVGLPLAIGLLLARRRRARSSGRLLP